MGNNYLEGTLLPGTFYWT